MVADHSRTVTMYRSSWRNYSLNDNNILRHSVEQDKLHQAITLIKPETILNAKK